MQIKNFIIAKNTQKSILKLQDNQLIMSRDDNKITNTDVYLSTADLKTGIIHNKIHILGRVKIEPTERFESTKYAIKEAATNLYYSCQPIDNKYHYNYIEVDRKNPDIWEDFDLIVTNDFVLTSADFFRLVIDNANDPIKMYWWRDNTVCNVGDEINPYIASFLSNRPIHRTHIAHADLLGIGSILDWAPERKRLYPVWGSGSLKSSYIKENNYRPYLLRGPLTHSLFTSSTKIIPYGDPGLLCNRIWPHHKETLHDWGIIPHHSQLNKPWLKRLRENTHNSIIIDVTNRDIPFLMKQISSCKAIASSSLHGLIIADSYQIPNIWLWETELHHGGQWKFFDYFSGIGRQAIENINPDYLEDLNSIQLNHYNYNHFKQIDKICNRIVDAFPL